jgi:hypothetical protein
LRLCLDSTPTALRHQWLDKISLVHHAPGSGLCNPAQPIELQCKREQMRKALFEGLVADENGNSVDVAYVGEEPTYVVTEDDFKYHVDAQHVDEQVLEVFRKQVTDNKDLVSNGVLKMLGKDDLFSKAAVDSQLRNIDKNFAMLFEQGIPEQARMYLGMLGFQVVINRQGDVVRLNMPSAIDESGDWE